MAQNLSLDTVRDKSFYLIGIKGTGMAALAELLQHQGARVSGSDVKEEFYTDKVLQDLNIPYFKGFSAEQVKPDDWDYVIRSSAYSDDHPEVKVFLEANKEIWIYTQALGALSARYYSCAVAGIHGKTTTTALAGNLVKNMELPASVLVGSASANFGNRSTWCGGKDFFIAETCEYQRHFLDFHPRKILLTNVDKDHLDYFKDLEDIQDAFSSFMQKLPQRGEVIYCADDSGAIEAVQRIKKLRKDLKLTPYGTRAQGRFRIIESSMKQGENRFRLQGFDKTFRLSIPGEHLQWNAAGALALVDSILKENGEAEGLKSRLNEAEAALQEFRGTRRRSEIVGEAGGVLVMDDYGHHPLAIGLTLEGFKRFYSNRRLVVSFMSHTYTRTAALIEEFSKCFKAADTVLIHDIYSSAREQFDGTLTGQDFFNRVAKQHPDVYYFNTIEKARPFLKDYLQEGDLFLTMGAGNNWPLGRWVLEDREGVIQ